MPGTPNTPSTDDTREDRRTLRRGIAGAALVAAVAQAPLIDPAEPARSSVTVALGLLLPAAVLMGDSPRIYRFSSWTCLCVMSYLATVAVLSDEGKTLSHTFTLITLAGATAANVLCRDAHATYVCPRCRAEVEPP